MRKWLIALALLVLAAGQGVADSLPHWLIVIVSGANDAGNPLCAASLGFEIAPDRRYDGVYYVADSSCGITGGFSAAARGNLKFQLAFRLKVQVSDDGIWLSAATDALPFAHGREAGRGQRTSIEKQLLLDQKTSIGSYVLGDGREATVWVLASADCPPSIIDCAENAVTLVSTVSNRGKSFAKWSSAQKLLTESMQFFTNPEMLVGVQTDSASLAYQVQVQIPGGLGGMERPTPCQIVFQRVYRISRGESRNSDKQVIVSYASKNTKDIVLEPGKELRLVFPPDTPSVQGYDIEDTLIILPR
jgi:hypothetical protein